MNLYAIKMPNGKWGMVRNKAKAIKLAKQTPGAEVWSRLDLPEVAAWDWPTFRDGATRVWPAVKYFGLYTIYGYEIVRQYATATGRMTESVCHGGNCRLDSLQTLPAGADGTLDIADIEQVCVNTGKWMAFDAQGTWDHCEHDMDAEAEIAECFAQSA
jgi:hypothetical protein